MKVIYYVKCFSHIKQTFAHFEEGRERKTFFCITKYSIFQIDIFLNERIKINKVSKYLRYKYINHTPRQ